MANKIYILAEADVFDVKITVFTEREYEEREFKRAKELFMEYPEDWEKFLEENKLPKDLELSEKTDKIVISNASCYYDELKEQHNEYGRKYALKIINT
jgi:hypothetical protein